MSPAGVPGGADTVPNIYRLLPAAYCLLPTACCLLPTAYCLLPTAYCLLPTASSIIQHFPDLAGERIGHRRLLEEAGARVEDAVPHDGGVGIARHEEHADPRAQAVEQPSELRTRQIGQHDIGE